jgi:hypothetical protein
MEPFRPRLATPCVKVYGAVAAQDVPRFGAFVTTGLSLAAGHGYDWLVFLEPFGLVGPDGARMLRQHVKASFGSCCVRHVCFHVF